MHSRRSCGSVGEDPEFERTRLEYVRMSYTRPNGKLPVKYKELVASGVLAFKSYPSLKKHLRRAMVEGATLREVLEAMEAASDPGGMASLPFRHRYLDRAGAGRA